MQLSEEIDQGTFARKHTEMWDRLASIKLQLDVVDRSHDEMSDLAVKVLRAANHTDRDDRKPSATSRPRKRCLRGEIFSNHSPTLVYRRLRSQTSDPGNRLFELRARRRNSCPHNKKALRRTRRRAFCSAKSGQLPQLRTLDTSPGCICHRVLWPTGAAPQRTVGHERGNGVNRATSGRSDPCEENRRTGSFSGPSNRTDRVWPFSVSSRIV